MIFAHTSISSKRLARHEHNFSRRKGPPTHEAVTTLETAATASGLGEGQEELVRRSTFPRGL